MWVEKKRCSITRLKHSAFSTWSVCIFDFRVEKKRCSITRLKPDKTPAVSGCGETGVEKKRCSITRLKPGMQTRGMTIMNCWKEKMLDYEIETKVLATRTEPDGTQVEKKRCSITRLKRFRHREGCGLERRCWKEKMLDYEIETSECDRYSLLICRRWKEKMLDYEIETQKANRLSDWETLLKRKDARLRDWNFTFSIKASALVFRVEKKRCSITRLKQIYFRFSVV